MLTHITWVTWTSVRPWKVHQGTSRFWISICCHPDVFIRDVSAYSSKTMLECGALWSTKYANRDPGLLSNWSHISSKNGKNFTFETSTNIVPKRLQSVKEQWCNTGASNSKEIIITKNNQVYESEQLISFCLWLYSTEYRLNRIFKSLHFCPNRFWIFFFTFVRLFDQEQDFYTSIAIFTF